MIRKRIGVDTANLAGFLTDLDSYETPFPLIHHSECFDRELQETMRYLDLLWTGYVSREPMLGNLFLGNVVIPMAMAHYLFKKDAAEDVVLDSISRVAAADWRRAGREWLERNYARRVRTSAT
jgi:hypothetical protein